MYFFPEPTREMALCVSPEIEGSLQKIFEDIAAADSEEVRCVNESVNHTRYEAADGRVFHFWDLHNWHHPEDPSFVLAILRLLPTLHSESFMFLRITTQSDLDEYGIPAAFADFGVHTYMAPRIAW